MGAGGAVGHQKCGGRRTRVGAAWTVESGTLAAAALAVGLAVEQALGKLPAYAAQVLAAVDDVLACAAELAALAR